MIDGDFRDRPYGTVQTYTIDSATCERVHPKPGEVVVALAEDDVGALETILGIYDDPDGSRDHDAARRLHRVLDRAREAAR